MQKALNICQTFLGSFFGVALGHCNRNCCNANLQCNVSVAVDSHLQRCSFAHVESMDGRHPPGGATAILAVTLPTMYRLGWFYVAQIAASSAIMLAWGLIIILASGGTRVSLHFWLDGPTLRRSQLF
jgi:CBS-domain-containing membrane protein